MTNGHKNKVLITGGAGFIGSHLAELLLGIGHEVYIIDDLSTGAIENIQHLKHHPNLSYTIESVTNRRSITELIDLCDVVYHLAAAVGVRLIIESPVKTIQTNLSSTEIVLRLAAKKRKRVIFTSTSEVYGKSDRSSFKETDDLLIGPPHKGRWSYACSKAMDEFLAIAYWKEKKVPITIARMFNIVGPRQTGYYGMVMPNLVRQALSGQDIMVFGDGSQTRCFTHVSDAIRALVALERHPNSVGEIYNIGSDEEVTILQLAQRIKVLAESDSRIAFLPYREAYEEGFEDMMRRVPDLSKIKKLIGYEPKLFLDDIIKSVIEYQRAGTADHSKVL